jgi:hypothetical protein
VSLFLVLFFAFVGVPLRPLEGEVLDQDRAQTGGVWETANSLNGYVGDDYLVSEDPEATIEYVIQPPTAGNYEIRMIYAAHKSFGHSVAINSIHRGIEVRRLVSQQKEPTEGYYKMIGRYPMTANEVLRIRISVRDAGGIVYADALQILRLADPSSVDN